MKKLDSFILKSFIGPFFAILLVVVFILMMQFLWLYIDELVGKGLSIKVILEFLGWGCATLLPLSLPLATLLSSMMTLGTLGENNELLAIKAAGISLKRILTPLMIASFIISVGTFFATNNLVPVAYNKIFTLRDDILKTKEEIKIPTGTFYDGIEGYIMRVNTRDEESGMMHDVMVYNHNGNKGNTSLTLADSALMNMSKDKSYLTFIMYHGANYEETNTRKYRDTTLQLQKVEFDRQEMVIPLENYAFQKSDETRFGDEVKSMNLKQLRHGEDSIGNLSMESKLEHLKRLQSSNILLYNKQLDTSVKQTATRPFSFEGFGEWDNIESEIRAYEKSLSQTNEYISTLTTFGRETFYYSYTLRRIDVETLKKFAVAIACFIFFFIGAPLGALIRKGGLGTPAIISVLFFVVYWVIDISGTKLANDGAISAASGVFISSYVLFPIGIFLTWKAINDSSIFSTDSMKTWFTKLKMKIMGKIRKTRIVYMGTPEFAVAPLDELIRKGYHIAGVVTVADKASGRGLKVNESAVKKYAVEHGIPVLQPVSLKDPEFIAALKAWKPDLFVVVAFRMLPKVVWEIPRLGTFNLHAALLPQYRGAAPINWAIINGEHFSGVTTFMIDDGMDTGHIILREQCRISDTDTAGDLHDRLMELGAKAVVQTVETIIDGHVELKLQKSYIQGDEVLKPAPKLTRELCHIVWDRKTRDVYNLIRGLSPYPGAYTELVKDDKSLQMKIYAGEKLTQEQLGPLLAEAGKSASAESMTPGRILSDGKNWLAITTADGAVSVTDLQAAGKKRMNVRDFLAGFREPETWSLS
ncbi:MAG: methionyl-tRNA formyltransferase [Bacteroidetes bacterium]|uniref:Methionyl-tRNA formyltransferase n=1 Tax=Candidatus Cryptobacteroides merdavium TaxID=2840769 RepID=A0A9D9ED71_9BACT|nr:methionyl-tRNA formyltransferase [Candidatus Cryptobacteroides merdavium]